MSIISSDLRKALGSFATGVTVVTTRVEGRLYGFTANSFTSVSLAPPVLLFCIGQSRNSYNAFRVAESFTINVLSASQRDLSDRFASSQEDKWHEVAYLEDDFGNAVFPEVAAAFVCKKREMIDAADHMIVLGEVKSLRQDHDAMPLIYCRSRYCLAVDMSLAAGAAA
jgi:flavin reductase (DIM6/NTAB) family NADH-FMN oxidoreductase RutF